MKPHTYAVLGTSAITEHLISGGRLIDNLTLTGVYSRSAEKGTEFAKRMGAKEVYVTLSSLAESDSDFIYVASPNALHFSQCEYLLSHGKNVLCEKPVTVTREEYDILEKLAAAHGAVYMEAIMYMHNPLRNTLHDAVATLGRIRSAHFDFSQLSSRYPSLMQGELPNIFNPVMKAGALNDLGVYCVYPCVDLFGMPLRIQPSQLFLRTGADGAGSAIFEYLDKNVTISYSKVGQGRLGSEIIGDNGTVTIGSISQLTNMSYYDRAGNRTVLSEEIPKAELMANEIRSMLFFLEEPAATRDFLAECSERSAQVLSCMEKMRIPVEAGL